MSRGKLSLVPVPLVLVLLFFATTSCIAKKSNNQCPPSSCGDIRSISYPFRLKDDPKNCGLPNYELVCENNQTLTLNLNSSIYKVLEIDYEGYSIRLVEPGLEKGNYCSSFPTIVLGYDDIPKAYTEHGDDRSMPYYSLRYRNSPIAFVHCAAPAKSPRYVDIIKSCRNYWQNYSYVVFGGEGFEIADVEDSCSISMFGWVSIEFNITNYTSLPDLHNGLTYGFTLPWYRDAYCRQCEKRGGSCFIGQNQDNTTSVICNGYCDIRKWSTIRPTLKCLREVLSTGVDFLNTYMSLCLGGRFFLGTVCLLAAVTYYRVKKWHLSMYESIEDFLRGPNNLVPVRYAYSDLKKMTNNFRDKLGEGGYGTVYKGKLRSGPLVAVKMLGKSKANGQEFISEVATIGRIHHVNVVKLIGFCFEGSKHALVYEFMPNRSLEKYILPKEGETTMSLSCEKLFEIALGVAQGIDYLHRGCEMQILHFDIKPHNILLDEHFIPKLSDFGLAKLYPPEDSIVSLTAARGTLGYMAPELYYNNIGGVSYKADVYSFGMLLLEMAGKRKNLNPFVDQVSQIYFPSWVYDKLSKGENIVIGDASEDDRKIVKKLILVALWCIQMKPTNRPSMKKVIEMLEGDGELLQVPPKPFQSPDEMPAEDEGIDADTVDFPFLPADHMDSSDTRTDRD